MRCCPVWACWLLITSLLLADEPIPALNSQPKAGNTLYLDFDGYAATVWGKYRNPRAPCFSVDADRTKFSPLDIVAIQEIWGRVAEDYAPFELNVTTVEPTEKKRYAHIIFGGNWNDWYDQQAAGIAHRYGYYDARFPPSGFVFSDTLRPQKHNFIKAVAEAASHEAGHLFGLAHISKFNEVQRLAMYSVGNKEWAPIMGVAYESKRTVWAIDRDQTGRMQNDLEILGDALGFVKDDYGDKVEDAAPLPSTLPLYGLISTGGDVDLFVFRTTGGVVSLRIKGLRRGSNLDGTMQLLDRHQEVIATATTSAVAPLEAVLTPGVYYLSVSGGKKPGSLGWYTISGEVPQLEVDVYSILIQ